MEGGGEGGGGGAEGPDIALYAAGKIISNQKSYSRLRRWFETYCRVGFLHVTC